MWVILVAGAGAFVERVSQDVEIGLFGEALCELLGELGCAGGALLPDGLEGVDGHGRGTVDHLGNVAADHTFFASVSLVGLHQRFSPADGWLVAPARGLR